MPCFSSCFKQCEYIYLPVFWDFKKENILSLRILLSRRNHQQEIYSNMGSHKITFSVVGNIYGKWKNHGQYYKNEEIHWKYWLSDAALIMSNWSLHLTDLCLSCMERIYKFFVEQWDFFSFQWEHQWSVEKQKILVLNQVAKHVSLMIKHPLRPLPDQRGRFILLPKGGNSLGSSVCLRWVIVAFHNFLSFVALSN